MSVIEVLIGIVIGVWLLRATGRLIDRIEVAEYWMGQEILRRILAGRGDLVDVVGQVRREALEAIRAAKQHDDEGEMLASEEDARDLRAAYGIGDAWTDAEVRKQLRELRAARGRVTEEL